MIGLENLDGAFLFFFSLPLVQDTLQETHHHKECHNPGQHD